MYACCRTAEDAMLIPPEEVFSKKFRGGGKWVGQLAAWVAGLERLEILTMPRPSPNLLRKTQSKRPRMQTDGARGEVRGAKRLV